MADITNREQELFEALKPIVEPLGVKLIDIEFKTHGEESRIRVVVDDDEGVGLSLCEKISKQVDPVIELEEPELRRDFELEVSSPGLRRRLRRKFEYDYFSGRQA
ncbi:MAG: ribosome maturation factor RimP, partial [bacterium]